MKKPLPPSRTAPQFVIRFPNEEMRDRIRAEAEKNGRSMNAEIIIRLEDSLSKPYSKKELTEDGAAFIEQLTELLNKYI